MAGACTQSQKPLSSRIRSGGRGGQSPAALPRLRCRCPRVRGIGKGWWAWEMETSPGPEAQHHGLPGRTPTWSHLEAPRLL